MIAVIDYGMGNLRSVQKALEHVGANAVITQDAAQVREASKIVLPGVGAMRPAMKRLEELNLIDPNKESVQEGKPFLGICLGFQLMFSASAEGGDVPGLNLLEGQVIKFENGQKVPQMGWNQLSFTQKNCPLYQGVDEGVSVYFCHSYFVRPGDDSITATSTYYGEDFTSSVCKENLFGVQFHPEKSQKIGLTILKNFQKL